MCLFIKGEVFLGCQQVQFLPKVNYLQDLFKLNRP